MDSYSYTLPDGRTVSDLHRDDLIEARAVLDTYEPALSSEVEGRLDALAHAIGHLDELRWRRKLQKPRKST